jgi:hypothetical protein
VSTGRRLLGTRSIEFNRNYPLLHFYLGAALALWQHR